MKNKNYPLILLLIILLSSFSNSCQTVDPEISDQLDRLSWSERNHQVINRLILTYGKNGNYFSDKRPPYIVLDWDQTCAFNDVEEALMHFQLSHLRFKLTKETFRNEILKDNINGIKQLSE